MRNPAPSSNKNTKWLMSIPLVLTNDNPWVIGQEGLSPPAGAPVNAKIQIVDKALTRGPAE